MTFHVGLLPPSLVAGFAVGCKFFVDMCNRLHQRLFKDELPGWAKQAISFAMACSVVGVAGLDFFEAFRGCKSVGGSLLTGLILAGLSSEVAHPTIELAKAAGKRVAGQARVRRK